ncbi:MAG: TRAP transporter substrate-binding protein DctP [Oscillibacter sp.]|nr:TRAP transporter substrate-binding protein DctP [Oscillibacter sp.]MEA4994423.1 TRAP transporter substrate-binding protein DctP [Oscillibacter sp.]
MKKKIVSALMAALMVLSLAACGGNGGPTSTPGGAGSASEGNAGGSAQAVNLKFNFVKSSTDPEYTWYDDYFNEISKVSGGSITYDLYPSEALGPTADMLEAAAQGEPVVIDCDFSYLANYVPDWAAAMAPYLIQEPEQIEKLWKSDVGQELCKELEKAGLHLIDVHYFGTRNLIANTPVTSRADIGKLKVRCAATAGWNEVVRVLGGNATNTPWSETYQALSSGVADAAESPYALLYSAKLYEPCKYIIKTEHLVASTAIVMSQAVYKSLSPEGQKAIDQVGSAYPAKAIELAKGVEQEYVDKLLAEGVQILDIDKTEFITAAQDTPKHFPEWTPGIYERIQEAIA